jgi:hypothetical protein
LPGSHNLAACRDHRLSQSAFKGLDSDQFTEQDPHFSELR